MLLGPFGETERELRDLDLAPFPSPKLESHEALH